MMTSSRAIQMRTEKEESLDNKPASGIADGSLPRSPLGSVEESDEVGIKDSASTRSEAPVDSEKAFTTPGGSANGTDWDGPDDPDNPLNWPMWKKYYHVTPPGIMCLTASMGASIYAPGFIQVQERFGISTTAALVPLSVYTFALGFGPVFAAPLSESFGRLGVLLCSPVLGCLFTLGAGFAPTFPGLVILRFFAGLCFSPPLAVGVGVISDVNLPAQRVASSVIYLFCAFSGSALGPVVGSFVLRKSWRWAEWTIIFFAIFSWLTLLFMSETYKPKLLARRRIKRGIPHPPSPFPNPAAKLKFLLTVTLVRPAHMLFTEPIIAFISLYIAFNFGVMYSFFAVFGVVFGEVYGFTVEQSGLVFLSLCFGLILAVPTVLLCDHFFYQRQYCLSHAQGRNGFVAPEHRLYAAMFGTIGIPTGLFWFAWTARTGVHWISPILAGIPFAWGNLCVFISGGLFLVDTYNPLIAASAAAAMGLLRYTFGAIFPLFTLQMYTGMTNPWASSLLGFIAMAMLPIPWVLFKFGPQIRARSQYDTVQA